MNALGTVASLAEVGEQLAWIGAALWLSPSADGVAPCIPSIDLAPFEGTDVSSEISMAYHITFTVHKEKRQTNSLNGQCWHNMFRNPVLVEGYPILRRPESNSGLEMPLSMMAALAKTRTVDEFDGRVFIKGFATMLVPTKQVGDLLIWHLFYTDDGEGISYWHCWDAKVHHEEVEIFQLGNFRHVVGWCSNAKLFAGKKLRSNCCMGIC